MPALAVQSVLVAPGQPGRLYAFLADQLSPLEHELARIVVSDDMGATWSPASEGLIQSNGVADAGIDPRIARTVYAIIMPKYGGSYLWRKTGDNQWETCRPRSTTRRLISA